MQIIEMSSKKSRILNNLKGCQSIISLSFPARAHKVDELVIGSVQPGFHCWCCTPNEP